MNQNPEQLARYTIDRTLFAASWQAIGYFDVFQVGLTATPDNQTFGYFNQYRVSDYGYEKAVINGVLVPYNVFTIETKITNDGGIIPMGEKVDKRERLTRRRLRESVEVVIEYSNKPLNDKVVKKNQLTIIIQMVCNQFIDRINLIEILNICWVKDNKLVTENTLHDFLS